MAAIHWIWPMLVAVVYYIIKYIKTVSTHGIRTTPSANPDWQGTSPYSHDSFFCYNGLMFMKSWLRDQGNSSGLKYLVFK